MQNLKKINKIKILEINTNKNYFLKYDILTENKRLYNNLNIQNLIADLSKKTYLNIKEVEEFFYIIKSENKYLGPFLWNENFKSILIPEHILKIKDMNKKIFFLKLFKLKLKKIVVKFNVINNKLNLLYLNKNNEVEQNKIDLDTNQITFFLKEKVKLNKILNETPDAKSNIFEQISNTLFELFFPKKILNHNTIYIFEIDKLLSSIPLELINYKLIKYNSLVIFNYQFIKNKLKENIENNEKNTDYVFKTKNNVKNRYIYIYSEPSPFSIKDEIALVYKNSYFDIEKITGENDFVNILNKYDYVIFSGHGVLKNNINTIIINNKPFPLFYIKNIKKIPEFFYISSCLTTTGFFNNNFYISLLKKGLNESITTQFLINEDISFTFFKDFIQSPSTTKYPLINYIYSLFKNFRNFSFINKYTILNSELKDYIDFII